MLATPYVPAIGTTKPDTTSTSQSDEPLVKDVTTEILGASRVEWREGFDMGVRTGTRRVLESQPLGEIAVELLILRAAAANLSEKADYWMRKADEFETEATYWHGVASGSKA